MLPGFLEAWSQEWLHDTTPGPREGMFILGEGLQMVSG